MHNVGRLEYLTKRTIKSVLRHRPTGYKKSLDKLDIDSYIKALRDAFDTCVSNPNFLHAKPTLLEIDINKKEPLRGLKIELPTTEFLHLHSIVILDKNNRRVSPSTMNVAVSSNYSAPTQNMNEKLFDTKGGHNLAFHTKYESSPSVTITFTKPQKVSHIAIKNRQDQYARRAVGLKVLCLEDGDTWKPVYNLGGLNNLSIMADGISKDYKLHRYAHGSALQKFATLVIQGKDQLAVGAYNQIPAEFHTFVRDSINRMVLDEKQIEWTSHGLRRSFRFWSKDEKRSFIRYSMQVVNDLTNLSSDVCLGYGSVLAIVRDKDLIPHDDDMDIIIAFRPEDAATIHDALELIKHHLEPKGYNVGGDFFNYWHVSRNGLKVDVFVGIYEDDDTIGWYPYKRGALKRAELFPPKKASLLDIKCTIPRKPERYLEVIYGPNWQKPDPNWHPNWSEYKASYRDIAGNK